MNAKVPANLLPFINQCRQSWATAGYEGRNGGQSRQLLPCSKFRACELNTNDNRRTDTHPLSCPLTQSHTQSGQDSAPCAHPSKVQYQGLLAPSVSCSTAASHLSDSLPQGDRHNLRRPPEGPSGQVSITGASLQVWFPPLMWHLCFGSSMTLVTS